MSNNTFACSDSTLKSVWKLDDEMLEFPAAHDLAHIVHPIRVKLLGRQNGAERSKDVRSGADGGESGGLETQVKNLVKDCKYGNQNVPNR